MAIKRWLKVVGVGASLSLGAAILMGAEGQPEAPKAPTAGDSFKNIKVLKDLPADQLLPLMQKVNGSLGVRCDFCHVMSDMSSDEKKMKLAARDMITMTHKLNDTEPVVHKKVTCWMCHHGQAEPFGSEAQMKAVMDRKAAGDKKGPPEERRSPTQDREDAKERN